MIPCSGGLLWWFPQLSFIFMSLLSLPFIMGVIFSGYEILAWLIFYSIQPFKVVIQLSSGLHCVSWEKYFFIFPLHVFFFPLVILRFFSLFLVFSSLVVQSVISFVLLLLGVYWNFWNCKVIFSPNGKFSGIIVSTISSSPLHNFSLLLVCNCMHVKLLDIV